MISSLYNLQSTYLTEESDVYLQSESNKNGYCNKKNFQFNDTSSKFINSPRFILKNKKWHNSSDRFFFLLRFNYEITVHLCTVSVSKEKKTKIFYFHHLSFISNCPHIIHAQWLFVFLVFVFQLLTSIFSICK